MIARLPQSYYSYSGQQFAKKRAFEVVTSPDTAEEIIPALAGYKVAVFWAYLSASAAATLAFNTASTAITAPFQIPAVGNTPIGDPDNNMPFAVGNLGEALTVTAVGAATVGVNLIYAYIKD